ncbi:MAG: hypothetical protein IJJ22_04620 [Oscillospiraceae bacterium]|nr:hypothetical protein [Oscillospiraceae bacterium]
MTETRIYVGLNDSFTLMQKHDTQIYINILKNVCRSYGIPFSFSLAQGGYIHENGEYTQENTLVISLIDISRDTVNEVAKDLCAFFHQESVLITEGSVDAYFINESL